MLIPASAAACFARNIALDTDVYVACEMRSAESETLAAAGVSAMMSSFPMSTTKANM